MAVLVEMVGQKIISGFRGVVDFYYCRGIPCARAWPQKPKVARVPAVRATIEVFKQANANLPLISNTIRSAYQEMVGSTNLTWKDMYFRGYISGVTRYFFPPDEIEGSS